MYLSVKFLHLVGVILSLGAMVGVLVLGCVARRETADIEVLRARFEQLVSMGGVILVAAGFALTHLRGWSELFTLCWLPASLAMIGVGLVIERQFEQTLPLHVFATIRLMPYIAVLILMVFKPQ